MTYAATVDIGLLLGSLSITDENAEGIYKVRSSIFYEKPMQNDDISGVKHNLHEKEV
jgi:hypothetical protein